MWASRPRSTGGRSRLTRSCGSRGGTTRRLPQGEIVQYICTYKPRELPHMFHGATRHTCRSFSGWQAGRVIQNEKDIILALHKAVLEWNEGACFRSGGDPLGRFKAGGSRTIIAPCNPSALSWYLPAWFPGTAGPSTSWSLSINISTWT